MKRFSWEIILAGIFFVVVAIYLLGKPAKEHQRDYAHEPLETKPEAPQSSSAIQVIDLENLRDLASLEELESLQQIEQAESLEKLKTLAHLIPAQARDEFLTEIDKALREFSNGDIEINIDGDDELIIINREYANLEQGNWGETSPGIYTYLSEFDASDISETSISLPTGSITIVGTNENNAKLTIQASGQISSVNDLNSQISTTSMVDDDEAVFVLETVNGSKDSNLQLQATLHIPQNMELSANTRGGHIEATNIKGDQVYETGGGHIKLNRVIGDIIAVSGGGHVTLTDANGDATLKSDGGHLIVKEFDGDVSLSTKGGNIDLLNISGEIVSSTQGGNVIISLERLSEDITTETGAGNIQIFIPKNTSADIEVQASNVTELKGFAFSSFDGNQTKNKAVGTLNGGGPEIIAFTKHGKVSILGND